MLFQEGGRDEAEGGSGSTPGTHIRHTRWPLWEKHPCEMDDDTSGEIPHWTVWTCSKAATTAKILVEAIAAWHEAEPRQGSPRAKPTLQDILHDYTAQVRTTPGKKTGMDLADRQWRSGPAFSLASQWITFRHPQALLWIQCQHPCEWCWSTT